MVTELLWIVAKDCFAPRPTALWRQTQARAGLASNAFGMAKCRLHPPRGGSDAGVAKLDGVSSEALETPPERRQRAVVRQEHVEKIAEIMGSRHGDPEFVQQRLEVLFRCLLAVKAR